MLFSLFYGMQDLAIRPHAKLVRAFFTALRSGLLQEGTACYAYVQDTMHNIVQRDARAWRYSDIVKLVCLAETRHTKKNADF